MSMIHARAVAALLTLAAAAGAQTTQSTRPAPEKLPPGRDIIAVPLMRQVNGTSPRTVALIDDLLAKTSGARRLQLVRDLGLTKLPEAIAPLRREMKHAEPTVRIQSARAAADLGHRELLGDVRALVADPDPAVRAAAVLAAAKLGDATVAADALKDENHAVVLAGLQVASLPAHAAAISSRVAKLPPGAQDDALRALGQIGEAAYGDVVAGYLGGPVNVRAAAVGALGRMKAKAHVAAVLERLGDEHPTVRRAAVHSLPALVPRDQQIAQGIRMLRDPDATVREAAARILAAVPSQEAMALLFKQLSDDYPPLHAAAREALVAAGDLTPKSAAGLMKETDPRRREDGSWLLGQLRSREALEEHRQLLADPDWLVAAQAAHSLRAIDDRGAVQANAALLGRSLTFFEKPPAGDQSAAVPGALAALAAALETAVHFEDRSILKRILPYVTKLNTPLEDSRWMIVWAFGMLGDPEAHSSTAMRLMVVATHPDEMDQTKYEALKAAGNLRFRPLLANLREIQRTDGSPYMKYFAQWSADQIEGTRTPWIPIDVTWEAETTVRYLRR